MKEDESVMTQDNGCPETIVNGFVLSMVLLCSETSGSMDDRFVFF